VLERVAAVSDSLNPYSSPQEPISFAPQVGFSPPTVARPYRSAAGKATFALVATGIDFALQILLAISFGMQWMMLLQAQQTGIDMATAQANQTTMTSAASPPMAGRIQPVVTRKARS